MKKQPEFRLYIRDFKIIFSCGLHELKLLRNLNHFLNSLPFVIIEY